MLGPLRSIPVTRTQLAAVAVVSALASTLIITSALGHSSPQSAEIAALSHRREVIREGGSSPTAADSADPPASAALPPSFAPAASSSGGSPTGSSSRASSSSSSSGTSTGTGAADQTTGTTTASTSSPRTTAASPVKHVFVIALSTPSFEAAWGSRSVATYLNRTLKPEGAFLKNYETLTPAELPDYLALISGQAPNPDTEGECATYSDFPTGASPDQEGQVPGAGCVYPDTIITIADQVTASGHVWKGYIDGETSPCVAPNSGAEDTTPLQGAGPDYAIGHNPFIYFHSLLDLGGCASDDVSLAQLPNDLREVSSTPRYSYIAPGACEDGGTQSCAEGAPAGIAAEDAFLQQWIPKIERSAAYKKHGAIVIVFAHSPTGAATGPVRTGALVLSRFAAHGKAISDVYNPYSILRGTESLLGYAPLAHAKTATSFATKALPGA